MNFSNIKIESCRKKHSVFLNVDKKAGKDIGKNIAGTDPICDVSSTKRDESLFVEVRGDINDAMVITGESSTVKDVYVNCTVVKCRFHIFYKQP